MAIAALGHTMYMFGGYSERNHLNDFYSLDITTNIWTKIECDGDVPSPRRGASMVPYHNKLYLYGGSSHRGPEASQDIFSFDPITCRWSLVASTGVSTYRHSAIVYQDQIIIHGGDQDEGGLSDKTYSYNISTNTWKQINTIGNKPPQSEAHCAALYGEHMVIFGGCTSRGLSNDAYALNLNTCQWQPIQIFDQNHKPSPRIFFCGAFRGDDLIVFGGRKDTPVGIEYFNDTWTLTLQKLDPVQLCNMY